MKPALRNTTPPPSLLRRSPSPGMKRITRQYLKNQPIRNDLPDRNNLSSRTTKRSSLPGKSQPPEKRTAGIRQTKTTITNLKNSSRGTAGQPPAVNKTEKRLYYV